MPARRGTDPSAPVCALGHLPLAGEVFRAAGDRPYGGVGIASELGTRTANGRPYGENISCLVIARPVRRLVVAIRVPRLLLPVAPCTLALILNP